MKTTLKPTKGSLSGFSVHFSHNCSACNGEQKSAKREFSDQAWAALISWGEISAQSIDKPICNDCYVNLREVLIDRSEEILQIALQGNAHQAHSSSNVAVG